MRLGLKIKELREARGWTQEDLGKKIDVKRQQIQAYESGKNIPPYDKQVKLCAVFGIDMNVLSSYDLTLSNNEHVSEESIPMGYGRPDYESLRKERDMLKDKLLRQHEINQKLQDHIDVLKLEIEELKKKFRK